MKTLTIAAVFYEGGKFNLEHLGVIQAFVHSPLFKIQGLAYICDGQPGFTTDIPQTIEQFKKRFGEHLEKVTVVVNNELPLLYALKVYFGLIPAKVHDVALMGRCIPTPKIELPDTTFLDGVIKPSPLQLVQLRPLMLAYVDNISRRYESLLKDFQYIPDELEIISQTLRMFLHDYFRIDETIISPALNRLVEKCKDGTISPDNEPHFLFAPMKHMVKTAGLTGGTLPVYLKYYGAVTGRFSGGNKFNLQSIPLAGRQNIPEFKDAVLAIRSAIHVPPGYVFVAADASQIEARILAWLTGEKELLEAFATGRDVYSEFAEEVFKEQVSKSSDAPRQKMLRQIGKTAILGLGYGMGAQTFHERLKAEPGLASLFNDGTLSEQRCREIVQAYRQRYSRIKKFWKDVETMFKLASTGDPCIKYAVGPESWTSGISGKDS